MPVIRIVLLWHMHQPFYKDLATGEFSLPWVRMHAMKDYYGMVKLLDEFPEIHQTFNLVPSLIKQLEEYVSGKASDPFYEVASRPAVDLTQGERQFALRYLFQANLTQLIGRYPRYQQLFDQFSHHGFDAVSAEPHFSEQDIADLQVLSQLAWFDEFYLEDPAVRSLIAKGSGFSADDQRVMLDKEREILAAVLPAYASAASRGLIEISTSPFYHPILPLLCDTDEGSISSPGLPLPSSRFRHPEDARDQLRRGLDMHEQVFGMRPRGVWPSEGSVSDEAVKIAHSLGTQWMATDEGVLGRTLGTFFQRGRDEILLPECAKQLYTIYRYEDGDAAMNLFFRDHSLSDLIGFVYSGMSPQFAVEHFLGRIREACQPLLAEGKNAVVPIILDGENAWEFYPRSGREFLRRLYAAIDADEQFESVTFSEAIARHRPQDFGNVSRLVPGSWIDSNFNVWIGAPEDNRSWDYLLAAREAYDNHKDDVDQHRRELAYEELLIAEGSDWNWWYGPEHHSANDPEFDELYRKHLTNIYVALGVMPPDYLAQPIYTGRSRPKFTEQTAFIHPALSGKIAGYFEWLGAAHYTADHRDSAMHGKKHFLDGMYAGHDDEYLYFRIDFADALHFADEREDERLRADFDIALRFERQSDGAAAPSSPEEAAANTLNISVANGAIVSSELKGDELTEKPQARKQMNDVFLVRVLEGKVALADLGVSAGDALRLRVTCWENQLPVDALPAEGTLAIPITTKEQLAATSTRDHWSV